MSEDCNTLLLGYAPKLGKHFVVIDPVDRYSEEYSEQFTGRSPVNAAQFERFVNIASLNDLFLFMEADGFILPMNDGIELPSLESPVARKLYDEFYGDNREGDINEKNLENTLNRLDISSFNGKRDKLRCYLLRDVLAAQRALRDAARLAATKIGRANGMKWFTASDLLRIRTWGTTSKLRASDPAESRYRELIEKLHDTQCDSIEHIDIHDSVDIAMEDEGEIVCSLEAAIALHLSALHEIVEFHETPTPHYVRLRAYDCLLIGFWDALANYAESGVVGLCKRCGSVFIAKKSSGTTARTTCSDACRTGFSIHGVQFDVIQQFEVEYEF
jgi:hypothetical protein